jgi:HEAT repeat protein
MTTLDTILLGAVAAAFATWVALCAFVLSVQRRRDAARDTIGTAIRLLDRDDALDSVDRMSQIAGLLTPASRDLVMRAASDPSLSPSAFDGLATYLKERWGSDRIVHDASRHRSARTKWRRTAALRILVRLDDPAALSLLECAASESDAEVADVALTLLGQSSTPGAVDVLLKALKSSRHPASRIAVHLEQSYQQSAARLLPLLQDPDPRIRYWCATLIGTQFEDGLEEALLPLTSDEDAQVRKAAIASLARVGDGASAEAAHRLLSDPEPFVRAHAARALGQLSRSDLATDVAVLLGDRNWWVRNAAKDALEMMGNDVWPVLVRCIDDRDVFVRNGAAEVFQNLGLLDNLIIIEAAADSPSASKIDMLRRIAAAGGGRFTDSLIERVGPAVRPRVRRLLSTIGLERVAS